MATTSDIKKGIVIKFKGEPHLVTDFQHVNPGKGSAFVRTKLKNIRTGNTFENTYKSGEKIEIVDITKKTMRFIYNKGEEYYFLDPETSQRVCINENIMLGKGRYLKKGQETTILVADEEPVGIELPIKITYKVIEAAPAVKGDTASGRVTKEVTLENGLKIKTPLFIKEGDEIVINTETGEYVERA
jgi:elongation factor P